MTGKPKDDNELPDSKEKRKELKKAQRSGVGRIRINNSKNLKSLDDPTLERDICKLTKSYLKGDAILDILANIPHLVYIYYLGSEVDGSNFEKLYDDKIFLWFMAFKILRFAHLDEV